MRHGTKERKRHLDPSRLVPSGAPFFFLIAYPSWPVAPLFLSHGRMQCCGRPLSSVRRSPGHRSPRDMQCNMQCSTMQYNTLLRLRPARTT
jgi:hypothetical protein